MNRKEIRERIEEASDGPWGDVFFLGENRIVRLIKNMKLKEISDENSITKWEGVQRPADAHFMAHARQDVPELLDAFEEALGFGGHTNLCPANIRWVPKHGKCDCGWDEFEAKHKE